MDVEAPGGGSENV